MTLKTTNLPSLFESRVIKIPNYQRGYSWEAEQIRDLLEDLELLKDKVHYTGTIVMKDTGEKVEAFGKTYKRNEIVYGLMREHKQDRVYLWQSNRFRI
jgi:uncharacterized protein with ParB-like and HNH nuclease domain